MTSCRYLLPAALALAIAASPTAAQESPDPAPAPQAVERPNRRARVDDGAAPARPERTRPAEVRVRERAEPPATGDVRVRERAEAPAPAAPSAPTPAFEEQGGRRRGGAATGGGSRGSGGDQAVRRGGVRNPDAGGGSRSAGQAIPRAQAPRPPRSGGWAPSYGRRYYGGPAGFGYYAYDPWSWYGWGWPAYGAYNGWGWGGGWGGGWGAGYGGYYGGGYGAYGGPYGWAIGGVRLKVDQRDAEVYVDGYYAGTVDDFDGIWQQLRLDDGGYRLEIRKPGYETLVFDVRVMPGRTITYRGLMVSAP